MKFKGLFFIFIIFGTIYFCYILFNDHGYLRVKELEGKKQVMMKNNIKIKKNIENLSRKVSRMKDDPRYIEFIMRNEFNMVSGDETVIYMGEVK